MSSEATKQKRPWYQLFFHGTLISCDNLVFYLPHSLVQLLKSGNAFIEEEGRKGENMEAGNIQPFDLFRHFSPERAVNILTLFYGWSLFTFEHLHSPGPPSRIIPLHAAAAR